MTPTRKSVPGVGSEAEHRLRWFAEHRQDWIAETLYVFGFINRSHIQRKFGISVPQASYDLRVFQRRHPDQITYDLSAKQYRAASSHDIRQAGES